MHLQVKITPKSKNTELVETMEDGTLKIRLKAVPERGKANEELIRFLSQHYKVKTDQIKLISGHSSTRKLLKISQDEG